LSSLSAVFKSPRAYAARASSVDCFQAEVSLAELVPGEDAGTALSKDEEVALSEDAKAASCEDAKAASCDDAKTALICSAAMAMTSGGESFEPEFIADTVGGASRIVNRVL